MKIFNRGLFVCLLTFGIAPISIAEERKQSTPEYKVVEIVAPDYETALSTALTRSATCAVWPGEGIFCCDGNDCILYRIVIR